MLIVVSEMSKGRTSTLREVLPANEPEPIAASSPTSPQFSCAYRYMHTKIEKYRCILLKKGTEIDHVYICIMAQKQYKYMEKSLDINMSVRIIRNFNKNNKISKNKQKTAHKGGMCPFEHELDPATQVLRSQVKTIKNV